MKAIINISALIFILLICHHTWAQRLYRWVDENGKVHYSDKLPAEAARKAHDELNSQGLLTKSVNRDKTDEERSTEHATRKKLAEEKKKKAAAAARQRAEDKTLLDTFTTERDILYTRDDRLNLIQSLISLTKRNNTNLDEQITTTAKNIDRLKKANRNVPENMQKKLTNLLGQRNKNNTYIEQQQQKYQQINTEFTHYLERYRKIKGIPTKDSTTSMWKVSQGENTLFIGGTIHILRKTDHPLPKIFNQAYQQADVLVFETDISTTNSPEYTKKLMQKMSYADDRRLETELSKASWDSLKTFMSQRNIPLDTMMTFKPAFALLTLTLMEYQRLGFNPNQGVEQYFHTQGIKDKKRIDKLETPDEQLGFLSSLTEIDPDLMTDNTLQQLQSLQRLTDPMLQAWRSGNMQKLDEIANKDLRKNFPEIHQALLVNRNRNWLPKIKALLKTPEQEMILVGALHLVGPEGVLSLLQKEGYKIDQLKL